MVTFTPKVPTAAAFECKTFVFELLQCFLEFPKFLGESDKAEAISSAVEGSVIAATQVFYEALLKSTPHSHSIVAGGLLVKSKTTLLMP